MTSRSREETSLLAASCGNVVKAWDPLQNATGYTRSLYYHDSHRLDTLAWSHDATSLAYGGESGAITLRHISDGRSKTLSQEQRPAVKHLRFGYGEGIVVSAATDGSVTLWSASSLGAATTIKETACGITALATAPPFNRSAWNLAFATATGDLWLYHVDRHAASRSGKISAGTMNVKTCLDFSPSESSNQLHLAAGTKEGTIVVFDANTRYTLSSLTLHKGKVAAVCYGERSDHVWSSGKDGQVLRLDLRTSKPEKMASLNPIASLAIHPNGRHYAVGTTTGEVHVGDRRHMNSPLQVTSVHPDSAQFPVSGLGWQTIGRTKAQKVPHRDPPRYQDSSQTSNPRGNYQAFPFSPVRAGPAEAAAMTPKSTKWNRLSRHSGLSEPPVTSREMPQPRSSNPVPQPTLIPPTQQSLTNGSHIARELPKEGLDDGSSQREQESSKKASMTPQPKTKIPQPDSFPYSVPVSNRKRARRLGAFSDLASGNAAATEAVGSEDELQSHHYDSVHKEMMEYWKGQFMKLREDLFEMHFQLLKDVSLQHAYFQRKHEELQQEHQETRKELAHLKKMVQERSHTEAAWEFFQRLGSPKYWVAPMVDQSELPFRMLCRRYGATGAYTPMLHARLFSESEKYRREEFSTCPQDRPLFAQFCANDRECLLAAAQHIQQEVDAIDLNLGCPQRIARRGRYGAFLMEELEVVEDMIQYVAQNLEIPITCKIRVFSDVEQTLDYARRLERAQCSVLAVHGRTRDQKDQKQIRADWEIIKRVKAELSIPVLANGNIRDLHDARECMEYTGADGVLSAVSLLENPSLFAPLSVLSPERRCASDRAVDDPDHHLRKLKLFKEYLQLVEDYPVKLGLVRAHMFRLLGQWLAEHGDIRDHLTTNYITQLSVLRDLTTDLESKIALRGRSVPVPPDSSQQEREVVCERSEMASLFQETLHKST